jgi:hypothetical protein
MTVLTLRFYRLESRVSPTGVSTAARVEVRRPSTTTRSPGSRHGDQDHGFPTLPVPSSPGMSPQGEGS